MFCEAAGASEAVRRQWQAGEQALCDLAQSLKADRPMLYLTCARGSSDHAATFFRTLLETRCGVIASSFHPSVNSVYGRSPPIGNGIGVVISQSGQSPDIVAFARRYRSNGNRMIAIVNDEDSPLARSADFVVPMCAGAEQSIAATKSFIASLFAVIRLAALHPEAGITPQQLQGVPDLLDRAWEADWSALTDGIGQASELLAIGRGPGLAVAGEAALKLKEVAGIHAEAFSAAEVWHGPAALLRKGLPVLVFRQDDEAASSIDAFTQLAVTRGCKVFVAGMATPGIPALLNGAPPVVTAPGVTAPIVTLPGVAAPAIFQPMLQIQSFYRAANALALARGRDPDRSAILKKITETV